MSEELRAEVYGIVQGVGFRWTVQDHAKAHHLTGEVSNNPDGSVSILAVGHRDYLIKFLEAIRQSPGHAHIEEIVTDFRPPKRAYPDFMIRY